MDFTKFWNFKTHRKPQPPNLTTVPPTMPFFKVLFNQLSWDLNLLKQNIQESLWQHIGVSGGSFPGESNYIFVHIPGVPGLLVEETRQPHELILHRASRVCPLPKSEGDAKEQVFMIKSPVLENFQFLDENYVRSGSEQKTLSISQTSEMLWLLVQDILQA